MWVSELTLKALREERAAMIDELQAQEAALVEASGAGDNSQNSDIFAVFEEQSKLNARLAELDRVLREHESATAPTGETVAPGTLVEVVFAPNDTELMIFGSVEEAKAHPYDVVTPSSPMGAAIAGLRSGESARVESGATFTVEVGEISGL